MLAAVTVGNVWATRKADKLNGFKLMQVELLNGGQKLVAIDTISAGVGDRVLICTGSTARRMAGDDNCPIDAAIIGIIDNDCEI